MTEKLDTGPDPLPFSSLGDPEDEEEVAIEISEPADSKEGGKLYGSDDSLKLSLNSPQSQPGADIPPHRLELFFLCEDGKR